MKLRIILSVVVLLVGAFQRVPLLAIPLTDLGALKKDRYLSDFRVANVYSDGETRIVGAKFVHQPSGAPVFLLQIETVPQAFLWVDTPADSDRGLPHALEHLLAEKGTKGRYALLRTDMELSRSAAASYRDFNFYSLASGSGVEEFFALLQAWVDALYHPDFTDAEAEREFYHFGIANDATTKTKTLIEGGSVYNEELAYQREDNCYFDLKKRVFGRSNPLAVRIGGDPDQMRAVTPPDIREFHHEHYRLGPTTGFIFVIDPKEDVRAFLERVSSVLAPLTQHGVDHAVSQPAPGEPKYPVAPDDQKAPEICPVPAANETAPASLWFMWKPQTVASMMELKLLNLFFRGLADGPRSLLYNSLVDSKTRKSNTGATDITLDPAPSDSPEFLVWSVAISGIPGDNISIEKARQIQNIIRERIKEIASYPDHSEMLTSFDGLISSYAQTQRRSKQVWMRNSPLFGGRLDADWKDFFEYLEMDTSFVRSLSEDALWTRIEAELKNGKNLWHDLIQKYHLQDPPYALATQPSPRLLKRMEADKKERISSKTRALRELYHVHTDQEALARFEQDELEKTKEIDRIESRVPRPHFTEHPPLTLDDGIRFSQVQIQGVPTLATLFDRPPTLELGLSFDLRQVPKKYYKYLTILPRCLDSLGVRKDDQILSYSELLSETQQRFVEFAAGTADSPLSHRADLTFKASVTSVPEFREGLAWVQKVILSSDLDLANVTRLRDIVAELIAADDSYTKQPELRWVFTPAQAFRYQDDALYLALESQFTKAHWDGRLYWRLHEPVSTDRIDELSTFATKTLSAVKGATRADLAQHLAGIQATSLEAELVAYWKRNLNFFPEDKVADGLGELAKEVQEDLRFGPARTIQELQELRRLVVNRRMLRLDLLLDQSSLAALQPDLAKLIESIPEPSSAASATPTSMTVNQPIIEKLIQNKGLIGQQTPWYLGLVIPEELTGNVSIYSDFVNYSQTDRKSLVRVLSSEILSGRGPNSLYMKSREAGLAYALFMRGDPGRGLIFYYADRSLDVPSLLFTLNSATEGIADKHDPYLVDYVLREAYPIYPRSSYDFSLREKMFVQDMRDGNSPEKVRRFYEALLNVRKEPNLLAEIRQAGRDSLCGILLEERCQAQQKADHSIFFFVGSEKTLSDAEKRLPVPKLLRVWPSDYWLP